MNTDRTVALVGLFVVVTLLFALTSVIPSMRPQSANSAGASEPENVVEGLGLERAILQGSSVPTNTPDPYPGGTAAPVPTQTDVPAASRKYEGWTGPQVAADFISILEGGVPQMAFSPTLYITSTEVTALNADQFGMTPADVDFQSPTDIAVLLGGAFDISLPAAAAKPEETLYDYLLLVVDRYSGSVREFRPSDDLNALIEPFQ